MVNIAVQRAAEKRVKEREESDSARRRVHYHRVYAWSKEPVLQLSMLGPFKWRLTLHLHHFKANKPLRTPVICPIEQYGQKQCDICETETDKGIPCVSRPYHVFLAFLHNFVGKTFRKGGKTYKSKLIRVVEIPKGRTGEHWDVLDEAVEEKRFQKTIFQIKSKGGFLFRSVGEKAIVKLPTKGKLPKEVVEEVGDFTQDDMWAHILNVYKDANFEYFGVEQPEAPVYKKDEEDEESADGSYKDSDKDDDDADESDLEDEDDEDDDKPAKKKSKKAAPPEKSKSKSKLAKPLDDDEDEESEEEEEDEKPAKKKKAKAEPATKAKSKKSKDDDEDEVDDLPDDEPDEEDEEDDEDEDEDEDEGEKPRNKSKSKKR